MEFPEEIELKFKKVQDNRYGENWDQESALYVQADEKYGLSSIEQIHGKKMSHNNWEETSNALEAMLDTEMYLGKNNCHAIMFKHSNPSGAATGINLIDAINDAWDTSPKESYGGTWIVNKELTEEIAQYVKDENIFIEVLLAPSFEESAVEILTEKKNIRLMSIGDLLQHEKEIRKGYKLIGTISEGVQLQTYDRGLIEKWDVVTNKKLQEGQEEQLKFAYILTKHLKSNSAAFVNKTKTGYMAVGLAAGGQSRVDIVEQAASKSIKFCKRPELMESSCMGTDSFFPFRDGLDAAVDAGASAIITPGGSRYDDKIIEAANEREISMVFCGKRVFKH